jgi:glutamate--cysteine ligase
MTRQIDRADDALLATTEFELSRREACSTSKKAAASTLLDAPISRDSAPLFVDHLRAGAKPRSQWLCGLEYELFGYRAGSLERLDADSVQGVLLGLASSHDELTFEDGVLTEALLHGRDARVTVEPGGQIELSGAPRRTLAEIESDTHAYIARLQKIASERNFIFLATGFDPIRTIDEQRWFPKARYAIMRPFLNAQGARAWDMMCRTCAVQVNLDYDSEADLAKKFVLGNRLAPIMTAIFASSPFENGAPSGYKSTRAAAWLETDVERSRVSPLAFGEEFSLEAFVAYTFNVPMIFTRRAGRYAGVAEGLRFGAFLDGGGDTLEPVFQDWVDHLTTIFTEARLKQYIELRSADGDSLPLALALQALWKGLMYDGDALDEALRLAPKLSVEETYEFQKIVARDALAARFAGVNVLSLAKEIIALAANGLSRIAPDEVRYLDVLHERVIEDELCTADILLQNWHGAWHHSLEHLVSYLRVA